MKVEVETMDFCDTSCPMLEIEESVLEGFSMIDGKTRTTFRSCKHINICRNAIDQYEKYQCEIGVFSRSHFVNSTQKGDLNVPCDI